MGLALSALWTVSLLFPMALEDPSFKPRPFPPPHSFPAPPGSFRNSPGDAWGGVLGRRKLDGKVPPSGTWGQTHTRTFSKVKEGSGSPLTEVSRALRAWNPRSVSCKAGRIPIAVPFLFQLEVLAADCARVRAAVHAAATKHGIPPANVACPDYECLDQPPGASTSSIDTFSSATDRHPSCSTPRLNTLQGVDLRSILGQCLVRYGQK